MVPKAGRPSNYLRGLQNGNRLLVGTISAGCSDTDSAIIAFAEAVWHALRKVCVPGLAAVNPAGEALSRKVFRFARGRHARDWTLADETRFFKDRAEVNHYRPGKN